MKHNLLYINCPICGQQLINLGESSDTHWYWCNQCKIEFDITEDEEGE